MKCPHCEAVKIRYSVTQWYYRNYKFRVDISAIPGIADIVEHNLGIPTSIANPFANVDLANRVPKNRLLNDSASLLIACGLAMRSVEQ